MPSVKKNPLYMLGDWLLTLCALGIILVEEIYKFFRYRLNLDSFSRFLREDIRWYRVWIHFTLAFLLPVMIFSIGITSQSGSFWSISITACPKACSLARQSASLRPW